MKTPLVQVFCALYYNHSCQNATIHKEEEEEAQHNHNNKNITKRSAGKFK